MQTCSTERDALNEKQRFAVMALEKKQLTRRDIAAACQTSKASIDNVMSSRRTLLGPLASRRLAQLASAHGHDDLADAYSAPGKRSIPDPDAIETDGDVRQETLAIVHATGRGSEAGEIEHWEEVRRRGLEIIRAGYGYVREAEAKLDGLAPDRPPMRRGQPVPSLRRTIQK